MWYELSIISTLVVVGHIFFGHFVRKDPIGEEMTSKWRRLLKFVTYTTVLCLISYFFGRTWFYIILGVMLLFVVIIHAWWLPKKKGINGLTGEPKEKYYELRGWTKYKP